MKKTVFTGAATALITPLTRDGIDYEQFGRLIDWQIAEGVDALVIAGTTGEGSTLTDDEGTTRYATMKNVLCDNLKAAINDIDKKSTSSFIVV